MAIVDERPRFERGSVLEPASLVRTSGDINRTDRRSPSSSPAVAVASGFAGAAERPAKRTRPRFAIERIRWRPARSSVSAFSTQATIEDGVLTAKRISGRLRDSHITGSVKIDVRDEVPQTTLDLTMTDLPLAQFARKENTQPPFEGMLQGRVDISGRGNSVHELASTASGTLSLSMSHGAMRN